MISLTTYAIAFCITTGCYRETREYATLEICAQNQPVALTIGNERTSTFCVEVDQPPAQGGNLPPIPKYKGAKHVR